MSETHLGCLLVLRAVRMDFCSRINNLEFSTARAKKRETGDPCEWKSPLRNLLELKEIMYCQVSPEAMEKFLEGSVVGIFSCR